MDQGRRNVICSIALLLLAAPAWSLAQGSGPRLNRVAVILYPSTAPDPIGPERKFWAKLFAMHGLVDGRDIEIVIIRADKENLEKNGSSAFSDAVRQAVALRPAAILAHVGSFELKTYFLPAAGGVPLVTWSVDDGTADSLEALHRRGENVTGVMYSFIELVTMRFGLMKELKPGARRAAILIPQLQQRSLTEKEKAIKRQQVATWESILRKLGLEFIPLELPRDSSADAVVAALRKARIDLVEVMWSWDAQGRLQEGLWEPLAKSGILASGVGPERAKAGALLGGWTSGFVESVVRLAAKFVRGARAADLPVERAREFRLAINLRTAKTLGITVPASVLLRADEVFE